MKHIRVGLVALGVVIAIVCTLLVFTTGAPLSNAATNIEDNSANNHTIVEYDIGDDVQVDYNNGTVG